MFSFLGNHDFVQSRLNMGAMQPSMVQAQTPRNSVSPIILNPNKSYSTSAIMFSRAQSNTIYTQPGFYSPVHTPQNWQMPGKRREVMQWCRYWYDNEPKVAAAIDFYCFTPDMQVLMADGGQKSISSVKTGDFVRSHDGSINKVVRAYQRETTEELLKIKVAGVTKFTKCTKGHEFLTEKNGQIVFVQAQELKVGDYLLSPTGYTDNASDVDKKFIFRKILKISKFNYTGLVYDLEISNSHSYVANRVAVHNSNFPMNGFETQCDDSKIKLYFDNLNKKFNMDYWTIVISKELFMLGDVFPFTEIKCPACRGGGINENGEICDHPGGTYSKITVMNPDTIDVQNSIISADEPIITLMPDEQLRRIVWTKQPRQHYDRIPDYVKSLILANKPIPLSSDSVSHLKHNASPYADYGQSIIKRLFKILAYKDKLMTAQWIVADRLILPIRIVKVGDSDRPAGAADIADIQNQLAAVAKDPNLTLVTHHAVDYDWYGCVTIDDNNNKVLCKDGIKKYTELTPLDQIATWNQTSGKVEYQNYINKLEFKLKPWAKAFVIGNRHWTLKTTPNHRNYMMDGTVKRSDELEEGDILLPPTSWKWDGSIPLESPHKLVDEFSKMTLHEFCRFAGFFVSEGHVKKEGNKNLSPDKQIQCFGITQNLDSPVYSEIKSLFEKFFPNHWVSIDDRQKTACHQFMVGNADLARWLASQFGIDCYSKKLPDWMLDLPTNYLQTIYDAMYAGDGTKGRTRYTSSSDKLRDQVCEIMIKMGQSPRISIEEYKTKYGNGKINRITSATEFFLDKFRITKVEEVAYDGDMWGLEMPNKNFFILAGNQIILTGNTSGKVLQLSNEYELINKEILQGLMINEALLSGEMAGYQGVAMGAEFMVRRLETWRTQLARWIEDKIYSRIARMRALAGDESFIDADATKELESIDEDIEEPVYKIPKIKWNDMNVRDAASKMQIYMQLHDKQVISTETLCEHFGFDYDHELERIRFETATQQFTTQAAGPGGAPGGGMGMDMGMGGDMGAGGMPPPDSGVPTPGGPGGAPGTPTPMPEGGAGGMPAPSGAAASAQGPGLGGSQGKVLSKGRASKNVPDEEAVQPTMVRLTSLEQIMYKNLLSIPVPFKKWIQFPLGKYKADFAIPAIKLAIECDGDYWHQQPQARAHDLMRDKELANYGWQVLRFSEDQLKQNEEGIRHALAANIRECWQRALDLQKKAHKRLQAAASKEYTKERSARDIVDGFLRTHGALLITDDFIANAYELDTLTQDRIETISCEEKMVEKYGEA